MARLVSAKPWISMWTRPRETIRALVDSKPSYRVFCLASLFALQDLLYYANWWSFGTQFSSFSIVVTSLILCPLFGLAWVYFAGWIFHFTGRWLQGRAPASHLRTALAWSKIPVFLNFIFWILLFLFGTHSPFILEGGPNGGLSTTILLNLFTLSTGIWSFVLLVQSIREIQHFSIGHSIINVVMGWVIYFLFFIILSVLIRIVYLQFA